MGEVKVTVGHFKDMPAKVGLKDCGHVILSCSGCGQHLVDVWRVKEDAVNPVTGKVFEWKLQALCWRCGDRSFPVKVKGRFLPGSYGIDVPNPDPDGMDDSRIITKIVKTETSGDTVVFHTKQGDAAK